MRPQHQTTHQHQRQPAADGAAVREKFARIWNTSGSAGEAARRMGMLKTAALALARACRADGIELKAMGADDGR